jgi:hypothetical protein
MATRSYIGVRNLDSSVDYIYCHFDGYPDYNGKILTEHYSNINRVNELLNLGDLSVLGKFIGEKNNFNDRVRDTCLAYGRDKGKSFDNVGRKNTGYDELITNQDVNYVYIFDGDYWECHNTHTPELINLYNTASSEV